jgi:hypothetical protein
MRALIVYESMFGNTRAIADAVAEGLTSRGVLTDTVEVSCAPAEIPDDIGLLVVGAPTHTFGLPRPRPRTDAARPAGVHTLVAGATGVREWVEDLRLGKGQPAATFDTKVDRPRLPGSAARAAERRLRDRGASVIGAATFQVSGAEGSLVTGELARARAWAGGLAVDAAIHRVS